MDKSEYLIAPAVSRANHDWGYILTGCKEALIAADLAEESWFPEGRDKRGRVVRTKRLDVDGRSIMVRTQAKGPCCIWVDYTDAERQEWKERSRREEADANSTEKLSDYASPEEFREFVAEVVDGFGGVLENYACKPSLTKSGYIYQIDSKTQKYIERTIIDLYRAIMGAKILVRLKVGVSGEGMDLPKNVILFNAHRICG